MEEVDRCIAEVETHSWKGYTIGDPLHPGPRNTRGGLDDRSSSILLRKG